MIISYMKHTHSSRLHFFVFSKYHLLYYVPFYISCCLLISLFEGEIVLSYKR